MAGQRHFTKLSLAHCMDPRLLGNPFLAALVSTISADCARALSHRHCDSSCRSWRIRGCWEQCRFGDRSPGNAQHAEGANKLAEPWGQSDARLAAHTRSHRICRPLSRRRRRHCLGLFRTACGPQSDNQLHGWPNNKSSTRALTARNEPNVSCASCVYLRWPGPLLDMSCAH